MNNTILNTGKMVTYESLRELAQSLSKVTGYRYIAFCETYKDELFITFSDSEMSWIKTKSIPFGVWEGELDSSVLTIRNIPKLDWTKCQFDCKKVKNEKEDFAYCT